MGQGMGPSMASGDLPAQVENVVKEAELRWHGEQVDRALGQAGLHEGGAHALEGPRVARDHVCKEAALVVLDVGAVDRIAQRAERQERLAAAGHEQREGGEGEVLDGRRHAREQHDRVLPPQRPHRAREQQAGERQGIPHVRRVRVGAELVSEQLPEGCVTIAQEAAERRARVVVSE